MENDTTQFEARLAIWLAGAQKMIDDNSVNSTLRREVLSIGRGKRYIRIVRITEGYTSGSVHAFIDTTNGDVLKPATWKAPAKTARGNLFDATNGLGRMTSYGPEYLR